MLRTPRRRRHVAFATRLLAIGLPLFAIVFATVGLAPAQSDPDAERAADEAAKQRLEQAREVRRKANEEGVASQKRIDEYSDETDALFARYSTALREIDAMGVYNRQMQGLIDSQEKEISSLDDQLSRVDVVGRSVMPMMLRMIDAIEAFVQLDIPFLLEERTERVDGLRKLMARSDVSNAEKYRAIMEAYQVENEFGRTIEAYRSTINRDGKEMTVDFLRFGRVALVYQTLDESESGMWDQESRSWKTLDDSYRSSIRQGLRVARKQAAPDLIRLPVPAAENADGLESEGEAG